VPPELSLQSLDAAAFHIAPALVDGDLLRRAEQLITEHQDSDATTNYSVQMGSAGELVSVGDQPARHGHYSANRKALGDGDAIAELVQMCLTKLHLQKMHLQKMRKIDALWAQSNTARFLALDARRYEQGLSNAQSEPIS
jgi:hypothetical protein